MECHRSCSRFAQVSIALIPVFGCVRHPPPWVSLASCAAGHRRTARLNVCIGRASWLLPTGQPRAIYKEAASTEQRHTGEGHAQINRRLVRTYFVLAKPVLGRSRRLPVRPFDAMRRLTASDRAGHPGPLAHHPCLSQAESVRSGSENIETLARARHFPALP